MIKNVIKRDGRIVNFDITRIENAIYRAAHACGRDDLSAARELSAKVLSVLESKYVDRAPSVEEIQDLVEQALMKNGWSEVAKRYILYRKQHADLREFESLLLNAQKITEEYVGREDWRVNENSNMNYSLQGLNYHVVSAVTSRYWLEKVYPEEIRRAHIDGDIHLHDLSLLAPYCCGWNLPDLLLKGFGGVQQKVESAPPKHFRVVLGQIVNFFYTMQGEAAGAQAFSNFDTYLAPFIAYDGLDYGEVRQCMEEFIFNLNVPTRVGFQTPFVNLTMDVTVPKSLSSEPVIIGGKYQERQYGEFQREMDMLNSAFCDVMIRGDLRGRCFSFPIPTYNIGPDFPWDRPATRKIMEMTARYGAPYFANFINSDLSPDDVRSMCCRLRLDKRELLRRGGGLFGADPLTGSLGVVTINMPRIGYLSRTKNSFLTRLGKLMDLSAQSLLVKRRALEKLMELGLYPYSKVYLASVKQQSGSYWNNHFNTIGLVGMHEAALNLGLGGIDTTEGRLFALETLDFMRQRIAGYQEEAGSLFNLEATPAEGTTYRFARLDRSTFPDIITSGSEEPYYTNSTHLPVGYTDDLFTALDLQDELQTKYTGGTVFHGFLGESVEDPGVLASLLKRVFSQYRLPYFTITPTFSICPEHGYLAGEQPNCPKCGRPSEIWSRVVGFYRPVQNWNNGKREEFKERLEFATAGLSPR